MAVTTKRCVVLTAILVMFFIIMSIGVLFSVGIFTISKDNQSNDKQVMSCDTILLNHGRFQPEKVAENSLVEIVCEEGYSNPEPYRRCTNGQLKPSSVQTPFDCFKESTTTTIPRTTTASPVTTTTIPATTTTIPATTTTTPVTTTPAPTTTTTPVTTTTTTTIPATTTTTPATTTTSTLATTTIQIPEYEVVTQWLRWSDARKYCTDKGGDLIQNPKVYTRQGRKEISESLNLPSVAYHTGIRRNESQVWRRSSDGIEVQLEDWIPGYPWSDADMTFLYWSSNDSFKNMILNMADGSYFFICEY